MYPNYYSQQPIQSPYLRPQQPQQLGLKGRPVSSIDEVRASGIDFDGSIFYFPDIANKRIYTKQINIDGTAILNMYELKEMPTQVADSNLYVTRQEFNEVIAQLKAMVPREEIPASNPEPVAPPTQYQNF